jgi:hypothetical protein
MRKRLSATKVQSRPTRMVKRWKRRFEAAWLMDLPEWGSSLSFS